MALLEQPSDWKPVGGGVTQDQTTGDWEYFILWEGTQNGIFQSIRTSVVPSVQPDTANPISGDESMTNQQITALYTALGITPPTP